MTLTIGYANAPLGHQMIGVSVAQAISDASFRAVEDSFNQFGVVVLRGQNITPEQQIAFSKRFGDLEHYMIGTFLLPGHPEIFVVSNIIENGKSIGMADAGRNWHSDMAFTSKPARASILYALEVPRAANHEPLGDTWFASTQTAYDALPDDQKKKLANLQVRNSYAYTVERKRKQQLDHGSVQTQEERKKIESEFPDVFHPLVRTHPITGRKCLYLTEGLTAQIMGVPEDESDALIKSLLAHMTRPEFVYRHRWCEGDMVIWDNCSAIHLATSDYSEAQPRRMHRTTIAGSIPF
jgi:taurine dioxygenase